MTNVTMTTKLAEAVKMDDISADEEFITAGEFEDATRTVVRTLGRKFDVDVVYAGDGAKTDGKTVFLPAQDPSKKMTRKQYAVGQGFANHETMHNLCTDIVGLAPEMERLAKEGKKLALMFTQAMEDVRIERAAGILYPGIPNQVASTADYAAKAFNDDYIEGGNNKDMLKDFKRIGPIALTWRGRQRMGYDSPYIDKCLAALPPEVLSELDRWCDMIEGIETGALGAGELDQQASYRGSREVLKLAEVLARDIEEQDDDDEDEEQPQGGDGDGDDGDDGIGDTPSNGAGGAAPEARDPLDVDMQKAVVDLLNEEKTPSPHGKAIPITTMCDSFITKDGNQQESLNRGNGEQMYNTIMSRFGGRIAVMKRKLERALLTASQEDYVSGFRSGRLDVRGKGVAIMQGRSNVYRRKIDGKNLDTAVTLLVDCSGSMHGEQMRLAAKICIALAECFERTQVDLEVLGFHGAFARGDELRDKSGVSRRDKFSEIEHEVERNERKKSTGRFHRATPIKMFEFKPFSGSIREYKKQMGNMVNCADGVTPDGDAVLKAASRLVATKKPKQIMLVMCDGGSGYNTISTTNMSPQQYTRNAIQYAKSLGIHMVGVGIRDSSVKNLYDNYTVVNELEDLDKSVIDKIAKLILGERFKVDNADLTSAKDNYQRRRA